ncbi:MAG: hypothetical protein P4M11_08575 [Candidatus Pacebacteria bacterium]|nr:hypothetical protein [Candidatus Paceibacterota bacterium]
MIGQGEANGSRITVQVTSSTAAPIAVHVTTGVKAREESPANRSSPVTPPAASAVSPQAQAAGISRAKLG